MITESTLYAIAMESDTAYEVMEELCYRLGMNFPPQPQPAPAPATITNEVHHDEELPF